MAKYTFISILLTILGFTVLPIVTVFVIPLVLLTKINSRFGELYYTVFFCTIQLTLGKTVRKVRSKMFEKLSTLVGDNISELTVLEIGPGYGENFAYYPKNTQLTTLELNPVLKSIATQRETAYPNIKIVNSIIGNAESMINVNENSIDIVVGTQLMCCIKNTQAALREIKRVLKPGGQFFFIEITKFDNDHNYWLRFVQVSLDNLRLRTVN